MVRKIARYGWVPDEPDPRDEVYAASSMVLSVLPARVDLRGECPPVYDQGELGSCAANAIAGAIEFDEMKEKNLDAVIPSRLFIYYNERALEGTVSSDCGGQLRDGIKGAASTGYCAEFDWEYNPARFAAKPPHRVYCDAKKYRISSYNRIAQDLEQLKGCLASGYPFLFGFSVFESFESLAVAKTGHAPMPGPHDAEVSGHAGLAVGYDDANEWFIIRNSWGTRWGKAGYFTLPFGYLTDEGLAGDFWVIRTAQ